MCAIHTIVILLSVTEESRAFEFGSLWFGQFLCVKKFAQMGRNPDIGYVKLYVQVLLLRHAARLQKGIL